MKAGLFGIKPTGYELWKSTTYYICQTPGRQLWEGLQNIFITDLYQKDRQSWPFEVSVDCKCEDCRGPWTQQQIDRTVYRLSKGVM